MRGARAHGCGHDDGDDEEHDTRDKHADAIATKTDGGGQGGRRGVNRGYTGIGESRRVGGECSPGDYRCICMAGSMNMTCEGGQPKRANAVGHATRRA